MFAYEIIQLLNNFKIMDMRFMQNESNDEYIFLNNLHMNTNLKSDIFCGK
jgi:hypothetical protein